VARWCCYHKIWSDLCGSLMVICLMDILPLLGTLNTPAETVAYYNDWTGQSGSRNFKTTKPRQLMTVHDQAVVKCLHKHKVNGIAAAFSLQQHYAAVNVMLVNSLKLHNSMATHFQTLGYYYTEVITFVWKRKNKHVNWNTELCFEQA